MMNSLRQAEQALRDVPSPLTLDLPPELVAPRYNGYSVANLGPTIAQLLGGPFETPLPPLAPALLGDLADGVERVLLIVFDAIGWVHLLPLLEQGKLPTLARWLKNGARMCPLTSVFPSTTTAATTSIWTGTAPAQHGLLGVKLFLKHQGMIANILFERPATAGWESNGLLARWGVPLTSLSGAPSLARQLAQNGIETRAFLLRALVGSSLSNVHYESAKLSSIVSVADLFMSALESVGRRTVAGRKALVGGYWDTVDGISHIYGPLNPRWPVEVEQLFYTLDRGLATLDAGQRKRNLLLVVADHGHSPINSHNSVKVTSHPELLKLLDNQLGGDQRAAYLYTGHPAEVETYMAEHFPDAFFVLPTTQALAGGLWGPEPHHPDARGRVGDLLLVARDTYSIVWGVEEHVKLGLHGGLTAEEMLVPLVAMRLDS